MPTQYQVPGVYVEEIPAVRPIQGVGTAVAAFIGFAAQGPVNRPVRITNFPEFTNIFGENETGNYLYLAQAVKGYFINGGSACYIVNLPENGEMEAGTPPPMLALPNSNNVDTLRIEPKESGLPLEVEVAPPSEGQPEGVFTLIIRQEGQEERFEAVTLGGKARKGNNVVTATERSALVRVIDLEAPGSLIERAPKPGKYQLTVAGPRPSALANITPSLFEGNVTKRQGLGSLEAIDEITMICLPGLMTAYQAGSIDAQQVIAVQNMVLAHCELMEDRVAILDSLPFPPGESSKVLKPDEAASWRSGLGASKYGALYYPWIQVMVGNKTVSIPPCGHIAGIYARTDTERGVHKAPANEQVRGAVGLDWQTTAGEQALLNPVQVNCLRSFQNRGVLVWGARTLSGEYINVRRLLNFIEESIDEGTQWAVFEPNDVDLWERVKRNIRAFLTRLWRDGALMGSTPEQAFYVMCDRTTMTQDDIDSGRLICLVGVAPVKPAEFVIIRISQWAGGGSKA